MSRDFLLPKVDFDFKEQAKMKADPVRAAKLEPHLTKLDKLIDEMGLLDQA